MLASPTIVDRFAVDSPFSVYDFPLAVAWFHFVKKNKPSQRGHDAKSK